MGITREIGAVYRRRCGRIAHTGRSSDFEYDEEAEVVGFPGYECVEGLVKELPHACPQAEAPDGASFGLRVSGDRTVPYWSLRWPVTWRAAGVEVELVEVERGDHRDIISHPALLRAILEHVSVVPAVSEEPGE